jgi:hypothetical protein
MNVKKEKMKKNIDQTEQTLRDLVYGDNRSMEVNVVYGLLGDKDYALKLTKQLTLDAYVYTKNADVIVSFLVLDVTINRRAFLAKKHSSRPISPEGLAVLIHKSARKLQNYKYE